MTMSVNLQQIPSYRNSFYNYNNIELNKNKYCSFISAKPSEISSTNDIFINSNKNIAFKGTPQYVEKVVPNLRDIIESNRILAHKSADLSPSEQYDDIVRYVGDKIAKLIRRDKNTGHDYLEYTLGEWKGITYIDNGRSYNTETKRLFREVYYELLTEPEDTRVYKRWVRNCDEDGLTEKIIEYDKNENVVGVRF